MSGRLILTIGIVLVILVGIFAGAVTLFWGRIRPVTLTYYGLWEDPATMAEVIADFERSHPNIKVSYLKQNPFNYRDRIANAMTNPGGPDIVRIHSTWLPMFKGLLAPVPNNVISSADFQTIFYPAHQQDLVLNGKPMAIPLEIDGLVLFVNEDLLDAAGLSPVATWEEFEDQVQRLTVRNTKGQIVTAGVAMGAASNVDHWQEIVSLLFAQNGASTALPAGETATGALVFYTDFVTQLGVWDETLENSTQAFANGKVAYYFAPSWRYFDIKELTKNSNLKFKILPVPQLPSGNVQIATYWAEGVSASSPNQAEAFALLKFLAQKDNLTKIYSAQVKTRDFGEPYSRLDLKNTLAFDPRIGPFLRNAEMARSSYLASFTWDGQSGINSRVSKYYEDAITGIVNGGNLNSILETLNSGASQVLGEFGVVVE